MKTASPLLTAVLVGAAFIIACRLGAHHDPTTGAVFAAGFAVLAVFLLYRHYKKKRVKSRDRAADDVYYLGLLLTLVSLIYTLIDLFVVRGDQGAEQVEDLIGSFGIALVSTVAGIFFRILLLDTDDEKAEDAAAAEGGDSATDAPVPLTSEQRLWEQGLRDEARAAVEDAKELRRTLREATNAFAHFTRTALSHADHVKVHTAALIEEFNGHVTKVAEHGLDDTARTWQVAGESLREAGRQLVDNIDQSVAQATTRTDAVWRNLADRVAESAQAATARLQASEQELQATLRGLAAANNTLGDLAAALAATRDQVAGLGATASNTATTVRDNGLEVANAHRTLMASANETHAAALRSLAELAAATQELREQLQNEAERVKQGVEHALATDGSFAATAPTVIDGRTR